MDTESGQLVTVANYALPAEGQVAKVILEANGIPVFLADAHVNAIRGSLGALRVRLQVPAPAADEARKLLAEHESPAVDAAETNACPQCGGANLRETRGRWVTFLLSLFYGLPLMKAKRLQCRDCNHRWSSRLTL